MDHQKAILADLMSQYVDVDNKDFWDDNVCKNYLVAFCPHLLFTNTKSDLGACNKVHNDRLKEKYQQSHDKDKYPYEDDFYTFLQQLINDVSRKIRHGRERVNLQDEKKKETKEVVNEERQEKLVLLEVKIKEYLQKIEEAGEEGRVQEASDLTNQVESLQTELKLLKEVDEMTNKSEKRMEVCEVCGALLVTHDTTEKPTAHFDGKQHLGYMKIREALDQRQSSSRSHHHRDYNHRRRHHSSRHDDDYYRSNSSNSNSRRGDRDRDHHHHHHPYRSSRRYHDNNNNNNTNDDRHRSSSSSARRDDDDWNREMERYDRGRRQQQRRSSRSRSPPRRW